MIELKHFWGSALCIYEIKASGNMAFNFSFTCKILLHTWLNEIFLKLRIFHFQVVIENYNQLA